MQKSEGYLEAYQHAAVLCGLCLSVVAPLDYILQSIQCAHFEIYIPEIFIYQHIHRVVQPFPDV